MEKTKRKIKKFFKFDKLGQRIAHASKAFDHQRKERLMRNFERQLMLLS